MLLVPFTAILSCTLAINSLPESQVHVLGYVTSAFSLPLKPEIRQEIKLDDSEVAACERLGQSYKKKMAKYYAIARERNNGKMVNQDVNFNSYLLYEYSNELKALLPPRKYNRLVEISIQRHGIRAFDEPCVTIELSINEDQKKTIGEIIKLTVDKSNENYSRDNIPNTDRVKQAKLITADGIEKVRDILSAEQRQKWDALIGLPFK